MSEILLAGATGLVGGHCLHRLVRDAAIERIVVLTRRPFVRAAYPGVDKLDERVVDFDRLSSHSDAMRVDAVICALGTTIKKAGSRARFRRVDHDYPLEIAELSRREGASHYLLVSALSANPKSLLFYSRVKGELEDDVRDVSFPGLTIVRPSFLVGDRDEFRLGEEMALRLGFLMPSKYKPVHAAAVAEVLVDEAKRRRTGTRVIESHEIRRLATNV